MKKTIKVLIAVIFFFIMLMIYSSVEAATASISASKTNIKAGESTNIVVSINAAAWNVKVDGPSSKNIVGNTDDGENARKSETIKYTPSKAGTYTFSISGDVSDGSTNATTKVSGSVKVVVTEVASPSNNNGGNNNDQKPEQPKEPTFKAVNEKLYATGNINVRKSYSADSDKLGSLQTGDEVTRTGVGDNGWSKVTFNGGTGYIKSSLLTAEQPKKSEDKALKSLTIEGVEGVELTPTFNPEVTEYSVIVGKDVEKVNVKAEANDQKSKVEITNVEKIEEGDNLIKIVVTAEDGTARTYSINVKKQEEKVIGLSSLKVQGYTIEPKFSADVYEYKLTILDPKVISLEIISEANTENAKVEVTGNTNINPGENTILIKVTSEDGKDTTTYKIIVNKTAVAAGTTGQNNMILYGGIGIIGLLVIAIIVVIVIAKRKSKYEEEEFEEDYEDLYGYSTKSEPSVVRESNMNRNEQNDKKNLEEELFGKLPNKNENSNAMSDSEFNYNPYTRENLYEGINNNSKESVNDKYNVSSNEGRDYPGKKFNYGDMNFEYSFDNVDTNKSYNQYKDDNSFGTINSINNSVYSTAKGTNDNIFGTTNVSGINSGTTDYNQFKKIDDNANNNGNYFSGTSNFDNYYSGNTNNGISNDNLYSDNDVSLSNKGDDWNYDDECKPRRSRGKHSK